MHPIEPNGRPGPGIVSRILLLAGFVALTFPYCFGQMGGGVDSSWVMGLNAARDRHLVYGRDIAFTYGPLGFVIAPVDIGSNLIHAMVFRLGLHALWWISVGGLLSRINGRGSRLLFLAGALYSGIQFDRAGDWNSQLTGVILLTPVGYLVLAYHDRRPVWAVPAMVVAAAALLAKFSLGVACAVAIGVWATLELIRAPRRGTLGRLALLALTYVGTLMALFRAYGGPLDALGEFLRSSLVIGSGYSSQMSTPGPVDQEMILVAGMALAVIVTGAGVLLRKDYAPVALITLFPLFVLFKGAIVRHDVGHIAVSCPPMAGLAAFLLAGRHGRGPSPVSRAFAAAFLGGCLWLNPPDAASILAKGPANLSLLSRYPKTVSKLRRTTLKRDYRLPPALVAKIGSATVDVYPQSTCYAIYNGLNWKPRFVFQSYCAYNPALDRRNADCYAGPNAPQFVIYAHDSIDFQHPCMVDPQTWIELTRWYDVEDRASGILLLKRRGAPRWREVELVGSRALAFGERWPVPQDAGGPVILQASPRLSPLGKLTDLVFKVYPPKLRVEYEDGMIAEHVLVWRNLRSGFVGSELPRSLAEVRLLLEVGEADRVRAVTFLDEPGAFEREFRVSWSRVRLEPDSRRARRARLRDVPQPVVPAFLNQMTWEGGTGRPTGVDPFVVFSLGKPAFVKDLRFTYSIEHPSPTVPMLVFWKLGDQSEFTHQDRCFSVKLPTGRDRTVIIPILDRIDRYRIDLDASDFALRISEIVLRMPEDPFEVAGMRR
jgi:hypothetical protein